MRSKQFPVFSTTSQEGKPTLWVESFFLEKAENVNHLQRYWLHVTVLVPLLQKLVFFCLCDGIGRHARLKTLSIMGPGSSPGAGNIVILVLKWLTTLLPALLFLQKFNNIFMQKILNVSDHYPIALEGVYSSWVLHVLFVYLSLLLLFRLLVRLVTM